MKAIVVGSGMICGAHIGPFQKKGVEIVALVDPNKANREATMERCGIKVGVDTIEEALQYKPDIASLCTPNHLHMPHAIQLMEAGVDVIVEKPMARTKDECDFMIATAERLGRKLFVAHSMRFGRPQQYLVDVIKSGKLGKPVLCMCSFIGNEYKRMSDPDLWKCDLEHSGGGVLIDNGSHMINMLLSMFGPVDYVESINGKVLIDMDHKGEDTAMVLFKFKNGVICNLAVTFVARAYTFPVGYCGAGIRFEVVTDQAAVSAGNCIPAYYAVDNAGQVIERYDNGDDAPAEYADGAVCHFIDCIREGKEPIVTMYDGRDVVVAIEAAYKSAKEGVRVYL